MRRADGQHDPRSSGTLVDANGKSIHLADKDFTLTPGRATFTSKNGAVYPTEWTVSIPSHNIELQSHDAAERSGVVARAVDRHRVLGRHD